MAMTSLPAIAKQADYERYICSLFAPAKYRYALWAVIALVHELMKIPPTVSEQMVGLVRLKWWQEHLAYLANGDDQARRDHPVLAAMELPLRDGLLALDMCDVLIESLASQCGHTPSLDDALATMAQYYRLIACAVDAAPSQYLAAELGENAARIGMIRMRALKDDALPDIALHAITYDADVVPRHARGLMHALYRHNVLWDARITCARQTHRIDAMKGVPYFAWRMVAGHIVMRLRA